jgi:cell division protease FtsH
MVTMYGMSELGPISTDKRGSYGYNDFERESFSNELMAQIDEQVKKILKTSEAMADEALAKYRAGLDVVTETLMKEETIDADRFYDLMAEVTGIKRDKDLPVHLPTPNVI